MVIFHFVYFYPFESVISVAKPFHCAFVRNTKVTCNARTVYLCVSRTSHSYLFSLALVSLFLSFSHSYKHTPSVYSVIWIKGNENVSARIYTTRKPLMVWKCTNELQFNVILCRDSQPARNGWQRISKSFRHNSKQNKIPSVCEFVDRSFQSKSRAIRSFTSANIKIESLYNSYVFPGYSGKVCLQNWAKWAYTKQAGEQNVAMMARANTTNTYTTSTHIAHVRTHART